MDGLGGFRGFRVLGGDWEVPGGRDGGSIVECDRMALLYTSKIIGRTEKEHLPLHVALIVE